MEDGYVTDPFHEPDQTITIHPDFPAMVDVGGMEEVGGSPFMLLHSILGDEVEQYQRRVQLFRDPAAEHWPKIRRVTRWYLDENWSRMFGGLRDILPGRAFDESDGIDRHHYVHFLYEVMFDSLQLLPYYASMKAEWNGFLDPGAPNRDAVVAYAKAVDASASVRTLQSDLFGHMGRFIDLRSAILPGFAAEMIRQFGRFGHPELRLCRDDFAELRDLYISTFETCHHILRFMAGVSNARHRGDPDDFGPGPRKEIPRDLRDFDSRPNASKMGMLADFPEWQESWEYLLDRPLRNAIGHQGIRHDLRSGLLLWDDNPPVKYTDFVRAVNRLVYPMLACAQVMKMLRIWSSAQEGGQNSPADGKP